VIKRAFHLTYKAARRVVIGVVGMTIVLMGVVMIVTPGPALVFIPIGLAILSIEFTWARVWLKRVRESISNRNSNNLKARANHIASALRPTDERPKKRRRRTGALKITAGGMPPSLPGSFTPESVRRFSGEACQGVRGERRPWLAATEGGQCRR
jgi:tellurite resistance protein TerC